jgi:hypothetical protein
MNGRQLLRLWWSWILGLMLASCEYLSFIFVLWPMEFWRQNLQDLPLQGTREFFNLNWVLVLVRTQLPFPVTEYCYNCHMTCTSSWACWLITTNTGYKIMQHTFVGEYVVEWNIRLLGSKCADRFRNMNQRNATWVYFLLSHSISRIVNGHTKRSWKMHVMWHRFLSNGRKLHMILLCFFSEYRSPLTSTANSSISSYLVHQLALKYLLVTLHHCLQTIMPSNQWASDASARNQLLHLQPRICAHTRNLEAQLYSILNASSAALHSECQKATDYTS